MLAVFVFAETTPPGQMSYAFGFLPFSISQVLTLSLMMLPGVVALVRNIVTAQKARGMSFRSPNVLRTYLPVMVPLFGKMLYRSEKMGLAMKARGYGVK
jgi:energy-coupling factor transporter transmembrane protein EcfT